MDIQEVLTRGVDQVLPSPEGLAHLMRQKKITLYQGFDPSMPSLHLGNLVGLIKLGQFQKLGHKVIFLVGDFTGMIGDPTDKAATRKRLTRKEVLENAKAWKEQAGRILDFSGPNAAEIKFNSAWNDKLTFRDLIEISSHFTHQQLIERDMFQKRIKEGQTIHFHELLYPIAQAIDSVEMGVDLEIGGTDQIFNMLAGRTLMKAMQKKEKYVLATKLLVDKDGNKVGKTTGNALFLDLPPDKFYAGVMAFPDETIAPGFELLTEVNQEGIEEKVAKDPMGQKKLLAFEMVKLLWGKTEAEKASSEFEKVFQKKDLPSDIPTIHIKEEKLPLLDLVFATKGVSSRSDAKRLIAQSAIEVNEKIVTDPNEEIEIGKEVVMRIGKTRFFRIKTK